MVNYYIIYLAGSELLQFLIYLLGIWNAVLDVLVPDLDPIVFICLYLSLFVFICLYLSLFAFSKFFYIMNMLLQVPGSNPSGSNPALLLVIYIYIHYIISYQNHIPILPPHKLQRLAPIFPGLFHVARDQFVVCEVQGEVRRVRDGVEVTTCHAGGPNGL